MNILAQLKEIKNHVLLDSNERFFISKIKDNKRNGLAKNASAPIINALFQMPEDYFYVIFFSEVIHALSSKFNINAKWINVNSEFQRSGRSGFLKRNKFFERKWTELYLANGGEVSFSHIFYEKNWNSDFVKNAKELFNLLTSKEDLLNVSYKNILIGDLIYDTYLRFKPAPTVNVKDDFLKRLLIAAVHSVEEGKKLFKRDKIDYLFTSYCSYIQHGVLTRLAQTNDVKVISFGSYDQLAKIVPLEFASHFKDYFYYKELFGKLSESEQKIKREMARKALESRFKGSVDPSTYYMGASAFGSVLGGTERIFKQNNKKRAMVFLHCFFDSPHIHRYMHYADFYEWITRTLDIASETDFDFYVKSHPNAVEGNEEIVEALKLKYPKINFLPASVKNNKLIEEGFDVAFTVYGTLGHEYPYFGIPVVNAGDNPHINYSFCIHADSREQYEWYVRNIDKIPDVPANAKDEILEFYYMHNYYELPGKLPMEENTFINRELRSIVDSQGLKKFVDKCAASKEYAAKVQALINKSIMDVL